MATRKKTAKAPARKKAPVKPAKKAPARKAATKKAAKKAPARKAPARKTAAKKATRRAPMGSSARQQGKTVEAYIVGFNDWRGETMSALRQLVHEAAPGVTDSIKWGQPVFDFNGPFAHMKAFSSHVNFGFWRGAELVDPKGVLKGTGSRMRHVELRSPADIDAPVLQAMVRTAVALNDAKGDPTMRRR
jgi:hypothetical protein